MKKVDIYNKMRNDDDGNTKHRHTHTFLMRLERRRANMEKRNAELFSISAFKWSMPTRC